MQHTNRSHATFFKDAATREGSNDLGFSLSEDRGVLFHNDAVFETTNLELELTSNTSETTLLSAVLSTVLSTFFLPNHKLKKSSVCRRR